MCIYPGRLAKVTTSYPRSASSSGFRLTLFDPDTGNLLPSLHGSYQNFTLLRCSPFFQVIPPVSIALVLMNPDAELPFDNNYRNVNLVDFHRPQRVSKMSSCHSRITIWP
jgi:hypothetical protein